MPAIQVFNVRTLWVKFVSCAAAVGSGLPVGPEGPMIHIGAMIGAALSQGHSTSLGFTTGLFKRFQNPKDKRDFVTAGHILLLLLLLLLLLCLWPQQPLQCQDTAKDVITSTTSAALTLILTEGSFDLLGIQHWPL